MPLLAYLRGIGAAPAPDPPPQSPRQRLLSAYDGYLTRERALGPLTVTKYLHIAAVFLASLPDPVRDTLAELSPDHVIKFVCDKGPGAKSISGGLRVFLRYLYLNGSVGRRLDEAVPPAAGWKLAGLPARLDAMTVAAVMATCDRANRAGIRDYAILILLARLGLRSHEVAGLEFR